METAVRLRIATMHTPDFVMRYPALVTGPRPMGVLGGWDIRFNGTALPFAWTPLGLEEVRGLRSGESRLVEVNEPLERRERSKTLAVRRSGGWSVGSDLDMVLRQLFLVPKR